MIIWLPLAVIFFINSIMLGSEPDPKWTPSAGFFLMGMGFLVAYIKEEEPSPGDDDDWD